MAKVAKKQRAAHHQDNICTLEPKPSTSVGRTRRAQRARLDKAKDKPSPGEKDAVILLDDLSEDTEKKSELLGLSFSQDVIPTSK